MYLQNVFIFINPGELHSIRARSKEVSMEYAVVFQPELLCSPFYDTVQTQLVQPLQNGRLIFPRCISANHPVFPIIKEQFQNITNAFYRLQLFWTIGRASWFLTYKFIPRFWKCHCRLADQLLIKASLVKYFCRFFQSPAFFPDWKIWWPQGRDHKNHNHLHPRPLPGKNLYPRSGIPDRTQWAILLPFFKKTIRHVSHRIPEWISHPPGSTFIKRQQSSSDRDMSGLWL